MRYRIGLTGVCYVRVRGGKRQRPNGVYDSWASVRVGGWPGHQQGSAEREILLLLCFRVLLLPCPVYNVISWKSEFRGMERTDVIRTTRSTLWYKQFGWKRQFLGSNSFQGVEILEKVDYRVTGGDNRVQVVAKFLIS